MNCIEKIFVIFFFFSEFLLSEREKRERERKEKERVFFPRFFLLFLVLGAREALQEVLGVLLDREKEEE